MIHLSKAITSTATILCIVVVVHGVTPDFSDYYGGHLICEDDRRMLKLGFTVSKDFKYLMEVENFKRKKHVNMYVRIAPISDPDEVKDAQLDYEYTKKKIEEKHPDTISSKFFQTERRVLGIPDFGHGTLKKEGKESVPCYYFVVEYNDDYSDYSGGTIVCQDGNSSLIELEDEKRYWKGEYSHTFKVQSFRGKRVVGTFVRVAPLSNFYDVVTTIGDWENTKLELENPEILSYEMGSTEANKAPYSILSDGNGVLKKDGKDDVVCYYFLVDYHRVGNNRKSSKK